MQIVAGSPCRDDRRDHQCTMRQIEDAGDAEDQGKAHCSKRIERADRKTVDQDLPE
jgi:hypothetical protein